MTHTYSLGDSGAPAPLRVKLHRRGEFGHHCRYHAARCGDPGAALKSLYSEATLDTMMPM